MEKFTVPSQCSEESGHLISTFCSQQDNVQVVSIASTGLIAAGKMSKHFQPPAHKWCKLFI